MERNDFIQDREDVIDNIKTLYAYLRGDDGTDSRDWAIDRMVNGRNYVVELIDDRVYFAPSRFVGYMSNTREKHEVKPGDGTQTDGMLKTFYQKVEDDRLDVMLQNELRRYGASSGKKKYWLPQEWTVDALIQKICKKSCSEPQEANADVYWHIQMHLPDGKNGRQIDPTLMLLEADPIIGTGEWDDFQCTNFKTIERGSIVLVRKGGQAIALCKIVSDNFTDPILTQKYVNVNFRKVKILEWADAYRQPPSRRLFSQGTFSRCNPNTAQYQYINNWLIDMNDRAFIQKCTRLLKTKKNIILQGAPGTGKTYNTAAIALSVLGITDVDLTQHDKVMQKYKELFEKRIFFTTFHQSLDYEDFVEGLKPHIQKDERGNGIGVTYDPEDGIFKRACAAVTSDRSVVLIIDEINRGNVSKIFGELITMLEADKRDNPIHPIHPVRAMLPYSKETFSVPHNLYVIGTMNTTDHSAGTLDYALRRRFAFVTLQADPNVIEKYYDHLGMVDLKKKALLLFDDIKRFITNPQHLSTDFSIDDLMVGHSYFMAEDEEALSDKIMYEIIPLVSEYINDGILSVEEKEKKEAFSYWRRLQAIPITKADNNHNDD